MWIRHSITVVISVILSVLITHALDRRREASGSRSSASNDVMDTIRTHKLELIDNQGRVRGEFKINPPRYPAIKTEEPMLDLKDENGNYAVSMQLNPYGVGKLQFDNWGSPIHHNGVVVLGALDADTSGEKENTSTWGLFINTFKSYGVSVGEKADGTYFLRPWILQDRKSLPGAPLP